MRYVINPGKKRPSVNMIDHIVYSRKPDLDGNLLELEMSIMIQNGNSEMGLAAGKWDEAGKKPGRPAIVWVPGGGYRGCDKNLMAAECEYLAEAGYAVASIYYRSSAQAKYPEQLKDVKTAVRFLRAHAGQWGIDPERIGIMGRSAGGHLSAMAAMNQEEDEAEEWAGYSSKVQAACDLFGPVDFIKLMEADEAAMKADPGHMWKSVEDTHAGAVIGGDPATMKERAKAACAGPLISSKMAPILILHGDGDPLVPVSISEEFYRQICSAGLEDQADLYILKGAGHGTDEFFQPEVKEIVERFFERYLKKRYDKNLAGKISLYNPSN